MSHRNRHRRTSRNALTWPARMIAVLLALVLTVSACGNPGAGSQQNENRPTLKAALVGDLDTLNPFLAILATSTDILRFQYEPLVGYGTNNELVPGLAEKWEATPDATTWTFTIGADRKWSDGTPVTAEDAAYTINLIVTNDKLKEANGGLVASVKSATATDAQTLQLVLNAPQASNPGVELPIIPKHVWEKVPDPGTYENNVDTVGSGPFIIKSAETGGSVQLVANENFWRGAPKIAGVTFVNYKSTDAAVQGLRSGEIDVIKGLTSAQFDSLQGVAGITTNSGTNRRYQAVAINPGTIDNTGKPMGDGNPVLHDLAVRQAIFYSIDKQTLLDRVLLGHGKIGKTEVPPTYPEYYGFAPGTTEFTFDINKANQILDQAGYTKGADGIRLDKQGKPISLRLMGRNTDPTHQQMADYIVGWLQQAGIKAVPAMYTGSKVNEDSTLGNYDIYFTGWGIGPDPEFQLSINQCSSRPNADGSGNTSENNYCSPEFDELYRQQHIELDQAKRSELVRKAFSTIYEAAVNMPIYYADALEAYRSDRFSGFTTQPQEGGIILSQNGYWGMYGATPVASGDSGATTGSGMSTTLLWVAGAVVVLVAAGAVFALRRRRGASDDKE